MSVEGEEDGVAQMANDLLRQLHVNHRVKSWKEVNSSVFVTMFEGLCGEHLTDIIRQPASQHDEVENIQRVIDTLSTDVLNTSLSHITAEGIVASNKESVQNLLEVFSGLMEYILDKIGSEASDNGDADDEDTAVDDPDLVTPELIDSILEKELNRSRQLSLNGSLPSTITKRSDRRDTKSPNTTADYIALGHGGNVDPSPGHADNTQDLIALGGSPYSYSPPKRGPPATMPYTKQYSHKADTTADMIRESEDLERLLNGRHTAPPSGRHTAPPSGRHTAPPRYLSPPRHSAVHSAVHSNTAHVAAVSPTRSVAPVLDSSVTPEAVLPDLGSAPTDLPSSSAAGVTSMPGSSSAPLGSQYISSTRTRPGEGLGPGLGPGVAATHPAPQSRPHQPGGLKQSNTAPQQRMDAATKRATSYESLQHLVADTVAMSRAAVLTSPSRGHHRERADHRGQHRERAHRDRPSPASSIDENLPDTLRSKVKELYKESAEIDQLTSDIISSGPGQPNATYPQPTQPGATYPQPAYQSNTEGAVKPRAAAGVPSSSLPVGAGVSFPRPLATASNLRHATKDGKQENNISTTDFDDSADWAEPRQFAATYPRPSQRRNEPGTMKHSYHSETSRQSNLSTDNRRKRTEKSNRKVSFNTSRSTTDENSSEKNNGPGTEGARSKPNLSPTKSGRPARPQPGKSASAKPRPKSGKTSSRTADELAPRVQLDRRAAELDPLDEQRPQTFQDYLHKYYGTIERRDRVVTSEEDDNDDDNDERDEASRLSDSAVDYGYEDRLRHEFEGSPDSSSVNEDIERAKQLARAVYSGRGKSVRFEELMDDSAPGQMGSIRRKLRQEDKRAQAKAGVLDKIYQVELDDFEDEINEAMKRIRREAKEKETDYKKKVLHPPKTNKYKSGKKYGTTSVLYNSRPRSRSKPASSRARGGSIKARKRSVSASPTVGRRRRSPIQNPDGDLLPMLLEEFPFLHLSTETLHDLWRKSARQMEQLSKAQQEIRSRKSKAQIQIEEAERRQSVLMDIMKKELSHNHRMRELKERQKQQQLVKSRVREKRQQSARSRKYYDEYQVRMRSKMLKKRTKEELVFRRLFREGLDIQRERIRGLRRYVKEQRQERTNKQHNELEALENYYRDQFEMLAETMAREREELDIREKAQSKILGKMKTELRKKMEAEIRDFQEQMYRDEDDEYFRQIDADRLKHQLQMTRYKAKV